MHEKCGKHGENDRKNGNNGEKSPGPPMLRIFHRKFHSNNQAARAKDQDVGVIGGHGIHQAGLGNP